MLFCDIFIIVGAVKVWYDIKQFLPPADQTVRVISQQWAWTFVHPGPDGQIDTADDIATVDELHLQVDTTYHFKLESRDVLHSFSIPVFRLKQDAIPGRVITGLVRADEDGQLRRPVHGDLRHRARADGCAGRHRIQGSARRLECADIRRSRSSHTRRPARRRSEAMAEHVAPHHHEEHAHHEAGFVRTYLFSTDHKIIAMQYMFTGMAMGLIGAFFAYVFRTGSWPSPARRCRASAWCRPRSTTRSSPITAPS